MAKHPPPEERVSDGTETRTNRRSFFKIAAAFAGGALLLRGGWARRRRGGGEDAAKVTVLATCIACTGCVSACPTHAISVTPAGIVVSDRDCIRCGYCVAVCPVNGLRVNRERSDA